MCSNVFIESPWSKCAHTSALRAASELCKPFRQPVSEWNLQKPAAYLSSPFCGLCTSYPAGRIEVLPIPFQAKHLAICKFLAENQHLRMHTHEQHQPLKSFVCNCMRFWLCTCSQKRFLIMFVSQPCPTAMCPDVHQHLHPPDHSPNSEAFLFLKETAKTQYRSAPCHHVLFYKKRMKSQP